MTRARLCTHASLFYFCISFSKHVSPWTRSPPGPQFLAEVWIGSSAHSSFSGDYPSLTNQLFLFPRRNCSTSAFRWRAQTLKVRSCVSWKRQPLFSEGPRHHREENSTKTQFSPFFFPQQDDDRAFYIRATDSFLERLQRVDNSAILLLDGRYLEDVGGGNQSFFFLLWDCLWRRCIAPLRCEGSLLIQFASGDRRWRAFSGRSQCQWSCSLSVCVDKVRQFEMTWGMSSAFCGLLSVSQSSHLCSIMYL